VLEPTPEPTEGTPDDRSSPADEPGHAPSSDALVERELLVEDVSIDGMCGVY
jgi:mycofactocin precursor